MYIVILYSQVHLISYMLKLNAITKVISIYMKFRTNRYNMLVKKLDNSSLHVFSSVFKLQLYPDKSLTRLRT